MTGGSPRCLRRLLPTDLSSTPAPPRDTSTTSLASYWIFINDTPTIYNLLESQNKSWRVYYGSHWFLCMTFLGQGQIERYMFDFGPRRMYPFEQFLDDAQKGNLPAYSFVEPNFMNSLIYGYENDMHPDVDVLKIGQASNVPPWRRTDSQGVSGPAHRTDPAVGINFAGHHLRRARRLL